MDGVAALQRRERIIAAVRWVGAAFMALQVTLYEAPSAALAVQAERVRPGGYAIAGALLGVALAVEVVLRRVTTQRGLAAWGVAFLAADVAAVMGIVFLYAFDPVSATWAIITVLPLEGAMRFQLRGALAVWAAVAALYTLREAYAAAAFGAAFEVPSVVYRAGIVLVIALFTGFMARDLDAQLRLLRRLAAGSQQLAASLDPGDILATLCSQSHACLGARRVVVYATDGGTLRPVARHPQSDGGALTGADARQVSAAAATTWLDGPGLLVVPLRWQAEPAGHVLVLEPSRRRPGAFERQVATALAESAALGLATARVLQAEQRTSQRLRYLEALRTRFVATIAHDLRIPLTVFTGVATMLRLRRDRIPPEKIDRLLGSVERQSSRLARLADDLLDAARLDADKLVLHPQACDLPALVDALVADVEEEVARDVPDGLELVADPARLERVLWNLLSNAEKYGRPPIELSAWADAETVHVAVRDHGDGLSETQRARLFSDFAGSDDAASVGLGLAIVWQLADAHGGGVTYEDADPGARFVVSLPAAGPPPGSP